ncbi:hypothetical protein FRC04_000732 [Tulasnella sp. 424]|nr:hypothetical protein FRC04_000732 [Tulasnella sp. 424]
MSSSTSGNSKVKAVRLNGGWNMPFNPDDVEIPSDHEMFAAEGLAQRISPISMLVDVPIVIWRLRKDNPMSHLTSLERAHLDNQSVTFLMINPWTGWAPAQWQQGIGPVIVARLDKKPLSIDALEVIWMFCDASGELASEGEMTRAQLEARYKPAAFQKWCVEYKESYEELGRLQSLELPI